MKPTLPAAICCVKPVYCCSTNPVPILKQSIIATLGSSGTQAVVCPLLFGGAVVVSLRSCICLSLFQSFLNGLGPRNQINFQTFYKGQRIYLGTLPLTMLRIKYPYLFLSLIIKYIHQCFFINLQCQETTKSITITWRRLSLAFSHFLSSNNEPTRCSRLSLLLPMELVSCSKSTATAFNEFLQVELQQQLQITVLSSSKLPPVMPRLKGYSSVAVTVMRCSVWRTIQCHTTW